MIWVSRFLEKLRLWQIVSLGLIMAAGLLVMDYFTTEEINFYVFYILPIILVTWYGTKFWGMAMCIICSGCWLLTDLSSGTAYSHAYVPYWNALARTFFFVVISLTISMTRESYKIQVKLSNTDPLTGIFNPRAFYRSALNEISRARRYERPLSLCYFDLDNFKWVNDNKGHSEGDRVLKAVSDALKENIRSIDVIGRLGGDEFALLMPETDCDQSRAVVGKLQQKLLSAMEKNHWPVTFSMGTVSCAAPPENVNELIQMADALMYSAKHQGKNRLLFETMN